MKRRLPAALAAVALAGTAIVAGADLAFANTGGGSCGSSNLGTVCISPEKNGYDAQYWNTTNHGTYIDFNLVIKSTGNWVGDQGSFTTQPGDGRHTYYFATGDQGCAKVVVYDQTGQLPPLSSGWSC
jgi:hypothetical protein